MAMRIGVLMTDTGATRVPVVGGAGRGDPAEQNQHKCYQEKGKGACAEARSCAGQSRECPAVGGARETGPGNGDRGCGVAGDGSTGALPVLRATRSHRHLRGGSNGWGSPHE